MDEKFDIYGGQYEDLQLPYDAENCDIDAGCPNPLWRYSMDMEAKGIPNHYLKNGNADNNINKAG